MDKFSKIFKYKKSGHWMIRIYDGNVFDPLGSMESKIFSSSSFNAVEFRKSQVARFTLDFRFSQNPIIKQNE
ncbi:hypothetical protein DERP_008366 [Dermatophagoides pteronyssinus]|uniref:Uncharacterized protein n=1 Tax=Dermatophagoides pteronyssinus TaxID=6956 RepID=A0ABQ8IV25_DERPT|nr:hypothetical protein DERP_008366 [Dermatophagoides pteronyssinus]